MPRSGSKTSILQLACTWRTEGPGSAQACFFVRDETAKAVEQGTGAFSDPAAMMATTLASVQYIAFVCLMLHLAFDHA